jgi:hypothetical protein
MTEYEQAVVKYLSLIAQELVRITEAIQDTSAIYTKPHFFEPEKTIFPFTPGDRPNDPKPTCELRPTFAADALEVVSEPKITLEK